MDEQVRILCVDDEVNVLKALERVFFDENYELLTAPSASEGLALLEEVSPVQIVISDYRMPVMNGVNFLREVHRRWPDTVRIVLSGYADTAAVVSAINDGQVYKFVPKPWNDDELKVTIANAVERYILHQKNARLVEELRQYNEELQMMNDNLEKIVSERTDDLTLRNRALKCSQNILNALPVAVLGMDLSGEIVQCNRMAARLFDVREGEFIGVSQCVCGPELSPFIRTVVKTGSSRKRIRVNGREVVAVGVVMDIEGQSGIILTFDWEE
jgi:two-component system NtrC family sensor kinase